VDLLQRNRSPAWQNAADVGIFAMNQTVSVMQDPKPARPAADGTLQ